MKGFNKIFREINMNLNSIELLSVFLNTAMIFLVSYLILFLVNIRPILALAPAMAYFVSRGYIRLRSDKLLLVEKKYKALDEKLRTAKDYINKENEIVEELQQEIVMDIRKVEIASFFRPKRESSKIVVIVALCLLIIFASFMNFVFFDLGVFAVNSFKAAENVVMDQMVPGESGKIEMSGGPEGVGDVPTSEDIYGASSVAILGERQTQIKVKQIDYEISMKETGEVEEKNFQDIVPSEIFTVTSDTYEENIPKEQEELVRNYFEKVAQGGK